MSAMRLWAVARKEWIQFRRDRHSVLLAFLLPVLLLVLFGYAITFDVENIETAVLDRDASRASRELVEAFRASGDFEVVRWLDRYDEIDPLLDAGRVRLALVIPADFARKLGAGREATVQVLVDGADANTANIVLGYTRAIVRDHSRRLRVSAAAPDGVSIPVRADARVWYNEELESKNMIVPGLVAVVMMIIAALLTSLTVAREWERGSMEQLVSTPVTPLEVVLGKLLPYVGIGLADIALVTVVGILVFDVPLRGSVLLLLPLSLAFVVGALGLGIFISAATRNQLLATQVSMVATFLPAFLLSGFMFEIFVMPPVLRALTYLIPARYFLVVTRGVFLKGVGADVLRVQGLLMIAFAVLGLWAATRAFRKELG